MNEELSDLIDEIRSKYANRATMMTRLEYAIHSLAFELQESQLCLRDTAVIAQERYIENERYKKALEHIRSMPWRSDKPYDLMDAVAYAYAALEGDENE